MSTKKEKPHISSSQDNTDVDVGTVAPTNDHEAQPLPEAEVFGVQGEGQIEFRTVGWVMASMFLIKQTFATGVLSIPSAMYYMGSVASCISIVFWGLLNAFLAYEQGQFKLAHPKMHTIVDGALAAQAEPAEERGLGQQGALVEVVLCLVEDYDGDWCRPSYRYVVLLLRRRRRVSGGLQAVAVLGEDEGELGVCEGAV